jgi:heat shock protein HslJ
MALLVHVIVACGQTETTAEVLDGTAWEMVVVLNGDVMSPANPTTIATLVFANGTAGGSTGCNSFQFSYAIDEDSIAFADPAITGFACHPEYVEQGDAVVAALEGSERFVVSEKRLELTDEDGTVLLQYRPADLLPLEGISWRLIWYGAGTSPLDGTEIGLVFQTDGTLVGVSGCNAYSADYRIDGESLVIGAITQTDKACPEPDGVMAQEADYLEAVGSGVSHVITLTGLELRDADGQPIAEFRFGGRRTESPADAATPPATLDSDGATGVVRWLVGPSSPDRASGRQ